MAPPKRKLEGLEAVSGKKDLKEQLLDNKMEALLQNQKSRIRPGGRKPHRMDQAKHFAPEDSIPCTCNLDRGCNCQSQKRFSSILKQYKGTKRRMRTIVKDVFNKDQGSLQLPKDLSHGQWVTEDLNIAYDPTSATIDVPAQFLLKENVGVIPDEDAASTDPHQELRMPDQFLKHEYRSSSHKEKYVDPSRTLSTSSKLSHHDKSLSLYSAESNPLMLNDTDSLTADELPQAIKSLSKRVEFAALEPGPDVIGAKGSKQLFPQNFALATRRKLNTGMPPLPEDKPFHSQVPCDDSAYHNEEGIDTLGVTITNHFRKETLEKELNIHDKPILLSKKMKLLLVVMELIIVALFSLFLYWMLVIRKATIGITDIFNPIASKTEEKTRKLFVHMTIYVVIFVVLLPHVLIFSVAFDFISSNRLAALTFALKLTSFCLFFGGWYDITKEEEDDKSEEETRDYRTHHFFNVGIFTIFIGYIVITGVNIAGHLFRRIFRIRILGKIFKIVVGDWFVDSIDHLTNGFGFVSLLTGVCAYLFTSTRSVHFDLFKEADQTELELQEGWCIRIMCALLSFLYILVLLANFQKHYINNHTHFIKVEEFKKTFLQFQNLYGEEDIMQMGQKMPKVTSAQRMI